MKKEKMETETEEKETAEKMAKEAEQQKAKLEAQAKPKAEEEAKRKAEAKVKEESRIAELGLEEAIVVRVVDGDTIVTNKGRKVRLVGVNTPESTTRKEPFGKEASDYTTYKLNGKKIWMQPDVRDTDRYGRQLRIIWLSIPTDDRNECEIRSNMFNAHLVLSGFAVPSTFPPDVKYSDYFIKFAREARESGNGLWGFGTKRATKRDLDTNAAAKSTTTTSQPATTTTGSQYDCTSYGN